MHAIEQLSQRPGIGFAEKNWLIQTRATSNAPAVSNGSTRGLHGESSSPVNAFGSRAAEARGRGFTGSATVVVGVIDEGLQINHPDLVGNVGANPGAISGNGIEDDGTADDHGTHVAGTTANAIRAVDYFTDLKTRHGLIWSPPTTPGKAAAIRRGSMTRSTGPTALASSLSPLQATAPAAPSPTPPPTTCPTWVAADGTTATAMGAKQVDTLTGLGGADVFLPGDSRGVFHDDRSNTSLGSADTALIKDFTANVDKLQVRAGTAYLTTPSTSGLSLFGSGLEGRGGVWRLPRRGGLRARKRGLGPGEWEGMPGECSGQTGCTPVIPANGSQTNNPVNAQIFSPSPWPMLWFTTPATSAESA